MAEYVTKRRFNSQLATGLAVVVLGVIITLIYWPIWGMLAKSVASSIAAVGLQEADPQVVGKYINVFTEGTFFWMCIMAWVWQTLVFGNYGKNRFTDRQPWAGLWYTFLSPILGVLGFLILVGFIGLWWKPFNLSILFTPKTVEEVKLAIEGWETSNFYVLVALVTQVPVISLFHKWPYAGKVSAPWDGYGAMLTGVIPAIILWIATIMPTFMKVTLGGHEILSTPFGSWPAYLAFIQCFIFWFLMPGEGGEGYPMKLFAKTQPLMGFIGLAIAFVGGFVTPAILRPILGPLNLLPGQPVDLVIASFVLSIIVFMLVWHHLFDDYPSASMVPNVARRVLTRIVIWIVGGSIFGIFWLKTFTLLPFAGNTHLGYPVLGILAGQFVLLMPFLYLNTFFDKWPFVYKVPVEQTENNGR